MWKTTVQKSTALSSTEAEYIAGTNAAQYICYARQLLEECGFPQKDPTLLQMDNQQAMRMAKERTSHQRTLHIEVRKQFLTEQVENKIIETEWIGTNDNVTDALTKPLQGSSFERHSSTLLGEDPDYNLRDKSRKLT